MTEYIVSPDGSIYWQVPIGPYMLTIQAEDVKRQVTGIHARLYIMLEGKVLAWSRENIEKNATRVSLVNSAYAHFANLSFIDEEGIKQPLSKEYPKNILKADLDLFCSGLWDAAVSRTMPQEVNGDPDILTPPFILEPYLVDGYGTILFAPPKRGKSFIALIWAVCIDAGINNWWPVAQKKVMFINLERNAESVRQRLGNVNQVLGLPRNRPLLILSARGRSFTDIMESVKRAIVDKGVEGIVLDSISRGGFGSLKEDETANKAIDSLNGLGVTWLALGHTPRLDATHVFGGVHFDAGADILIQLSSERAKDNSLGIALKITDANDIPIPVQPQLLALSFGPKGLAGIRHAEPWEYPKLLEGIKPIMFDDVKEYLLEAGKATAPEIAEETQHSRSAVADMLAHNQYFVRVGKDGKKVLYGIRAQEDYQ